MKVQLIYTTMISMTNQLENVVLQEDHLNVKAVEENQVEENQVEENQVEENQVEDLDNLNYL